MTPTSAHTIIARICTCIAVLLLLFTFIAPHMLCQRMYNTAEPIVTEAMDALLLDDWAAVGNAVNTLCESISAYEQPLLFFFQHTDVNKLSTLAEEALYLVQVQSDELVICLVEIRHLLEHFVDLETFNIYNLF